MIIKIIKPLSWPCPSGHGRQLSDETSKKTVFPTTKREVIIKKRATVWATATKYFRNSLAVAQTVANLLLLRIK